MWDEAVRAFAALHGRVVTGWVGVAWALTGGEDGELAVFARPDVPFAQFWQLEPVFATGARRAVTPYQDDTAWGLQVRDPLPVPPDGGVTRTGAPDLPTGPLEVLDLHEDGGVLAEVLLAVGGYRLLLIAGEVEPGWEGELAFVRHDESVLVFEDPAAADTLDWRPPRPPGSGARQPPDQPRLEVREAPHRHA